MTIPNHCPSCNSDYIGKVHHPTHFCYWLICHVCGLEWWAAGDMIFELNTEGKLTDVMWQEVALDAAAHA